MKKHILIFILLVAAICFATLMAKVPQEYALDTKRLDEASGLARSLLNPNILYSHNDSGGANAVYAINTEGQLKAKIVIDGVKNRDWEDIATARDSQTGIPYIYIGEIGDNLSRHPSVAVYKLAEPSLAMGDTLILANTYETFNIQYEDGPRDAEALFVDPRSQDIYIISKREDQVGIYRVAYPQSTTSINIAKKQGKMQMSWVTAADISANGKYILVKNYMGIRRYKRGAKMSIAEALGRKGKNLPYKLEPQGEAVCFDASGKGYFTLSEAAQSGPQMLYHYK